MSRRYFDLDVPARLGNYSMARHLAGRGFVVITIDPPGVGESDAPDDGYALTPGTVADVVAHAVDDLTSRLAAGTIAGGLVPALPDVVTIGVGHSAGGLLTVHQQARHRTHHALVLLGFNGDGLPSHLTDEERRYAGDPAALRVALAQLTAARFGDPLPSGGTATSPFLVRGEPPPEALDAIGAASSAMLALVGLTSMIPGSSRDELAAVDVPVFIGVGELDITGAAHRIPAHLPSSRDVTLFVLEAAGHNHNVAGNREVLWDRIGRWADSAPWITG